MSVVVVGDIIQDVYHMVSYGRKRFTLEEREINCRGGASLVAMAGGTLALIQIGGSPYYTVHRFIDKTSNETVFEYDNDVQYTRPEKLGEYYLTLSAATKMITEKRTSGGNNILVLVDYNLGQVNTNPGLMVPVVEEYKWQYGIVDSKNHTLSPGLLKGCETKILHVSGNEYDESWIRKMKFDYVVHSDGPNPVRLIDTATSVVVQLPVPQDTKVLRTAGAGDVMTGSIAKYIVGLYGNAPLEQVVKSAIVDCQKFISSYSTYL